MHYHVYMEVYHMRTNIALTKWEVVEKALQEFVAARSRKDLSDLRGQIQFSDNYDYKALREGR